MGGNGNKKVESGETITVDFNQAVNTATGPSATDTVCSDIVQEVIVIGSTTAAGSCDSTTETATIGTMISSSNFMKVDARYDASYLWSNGNKTLTITIGPRTFGNKNADARGVLTLTPASTVLEAAAGNGICTSNAGGGDCLPTTTDTPF